MDISVIQKLMSRFIISLETLATSERNNFQPVLPAWSNDHLSTFCLSIFELENEGDCRHWEMVHISPPDTPFKTIPLNLLIKASERLRIFWMNVLH